MHLTHRKGEARVQQGDRARWRKSDIAWAKKVLAIVVSPPEWKEEAHKILKGVRK